MVVESAEFPHHALWKLLLSMQNAGKVGSHSGQLVVVALVNPETGRLGPGCTPSGAWVGIGEAGDAQPASQAPTQPCRLRWTLSRDVFLPRFTGEDDVV